MGRQRAKRRDAEGTPTRARTGLRMPNIVCAVAAFAALTGSGLALGLATAEPVVTAGNEARSGELSLWVMSSEWLQHDHSKHSHDDDGAGDDDHGAGVDPNEIPTGSITDVEQGFQMPSSMMPGTPDEGFQRLQVNVTTTNGGATDSRVAPDDFELVGPDDSSWAPLEGGTFVPMTIPPGHAFSTVLAFDVPTASISNDLYIEWHWSGTTTRLTITETEGHDHG